MDELMKGRTAFVIAHRLSTIENADIILVVNEGKIVEKGTHSELINKGGLYSQIHKSQYFSQTE
jgi:ATP-binding cassette subfamily B protein